MSGQLFPPRENPLNSQFLRNLPLESQLLWAPNIQAQALVMPPPKPSGLSFHWHHAAPGTFPVVGSVPKWRRKSKMWGSGR
mmetsp:Transcript_82652/g.101342  ORF Transcript_82652/g.101342 Transcript_82652/m.101342 type:complete len:81 (-) Transcript_82652:161-403(-)